MISEILSGKHPGSRQNVSDHLNRLQTVSKSFGPLGKLNGNRNGLNRVLCSINGNGCSHLKDFRSVRWICLRLNSLRAWNSLAVALFFTLAIKLILVPGRVHRRPDCTEPAHFSDLGHS
jgi:hypothetical protein